MRRRIFIAIELSEELREKIMEAVKRWQWLPIRWVPPQNWHITLIPPFYVLDEDLEQIKTAITKEADRFSSFTLSFDSIVLAPPERRARMIWLSGAPADNLERLKDVLEDGIISENILREFKKQGRLALSHITLARFEEGGLDQIEKKTKVLEKLPLTLTVSSINIMESRLKITGAEYTLLDRIPLLSNNEASVL